MGSGQQTGGCPVGGQVRAAGGDSQHAGLGRNTAKGRRQLRAGACGNEAVDDGFSLEGGGHCEALHGTSVHTSKLRMRDAAKSRSDGAAACLRSGHSTRRAVARPRGGRERERGGGALVLRSTQAQTQGRWGFGVSVACSALAGWPRR